MLAADPVPPHPHICRRRFSRRILANRLAGARDELPELPEQRPVFREHRGDHLPQLPEAHAAGEPRHGARRPPAALQGGDRHGRPHRHRAPGRRNRACRPQCMRTQSSFHPLRDARLLPLGDEGLGGSQVVLHLRLQQCICAPIAGPFRQGPSSPQHKHSPSSPHVRGGKRSQRLVGAAPSGGVNDGDSNAYVPRARGAWVRGR